MNQVIHTSIIPWGNSHGIRISKEILRALHILPKDDLIMHIEDNRIIIEKAVCRKSLEEYARPYGGRLGPYEEFDFGEGIGIERWLDEEN